MRDHFINWPFRRSVRAITSRVVRLAVLIVLIVPRGNLRAEAAEAIPAIHFANQACDPFGPVEAESDPFETVLSDSPVDAAAYLPKRTRRETRPANFQAPASGDAKQVPATNSTQPFADDATPALNAPAQPAATAKDPCAAAVFKPLRELGISIAQPTGQMPTDQATPCWDQINAGPNGACRCWPVLCYQWDATCLCYQPLYFEEINAERYGYVCDDCCCCCCCPGNCVQSAASAAHFFATVPALPYCLVAECPTECVYTLGHYRPGTCGVPWRWHWPPCDPVAAASTGGIYTGLIFAIP